MCTIAIVRVFGTPTWCSSAAVNRRLDEWVTADRFDVHRVEDKSHSARHEKQTVIEVGSEGGDRKITRTYKRKWDEINHVQKVRLTFRFLARLMRPL